MPREELLIRSVVTDYSKLEPHLKHAELGTFFDLPEAMLHVT